MQQINTNVGAQLGALELNAALVLGDGALESAAAVSLGPTQINAPFCHHIEDGAVEETAFQAQPHTMRRSLAGCF